MSIKSLPILTISNIVSSIPIAFFHIFFKNISLASVIIFILPSATDHPSSSFESLHPSNLFITLPKSLTRSGYQFLRLIHFHLTSSTSTYHTIFFLLIILHPFHPSSCPRIQALPVPMRAILDVASPVSPLPSPRLLSSLMRRSPRCLLV